MEFAKRLKSLRENKRLSQEELADELNIPRSSITNYESEDNDRLPRNQRLQNIATFFGVSVDYLLGRDDSSYIESAPDEIKDIVSRFENIEDIIKEFYITRFRQMYRDMEHYIESERRTSEELWKETFDYSQFESFQTPEDVYNSLSFNFKIQYFHSMIVDAKIKKKSFEEYLESYNVSYQYKKVVHEIQSVSMKVALNTVDHMLRNTQQFLQKLSRTSRNEIKETGVDNEVVQIPIYGTIKAGYDHVAEENIIGYKVAAKREVSDGEYFYLIVKGDSMVDEGIREGHSVLVKKQTFVENGKIGVIIVNGDEATLKRVYYDGDNVILQASNNTIPPRVLSVNDVLIQGQVKSVVWDV